MIFSLSRHGKRMKTMPCHSNLLGPRDRAPLERTRSRASSFSVKMLSNNVTTLTKKWTLTMISTLTKWGKLSKTSSTTNVSCRIMKRSSQATRSFWMLKIVRTTKSDRNRSKQPRRSSHGKFKRNLASTFRTSLTTSGKIWTRTKASPSLQLKRWTNLPVPNNSMTIHRIWKVPASIEWWRINHSGESKEWSKMNAS